MNQNTHYNLGWVFYREYFRETPPVSQGFYDEINGKLKRADLPENIPEAPHESLSLCLKTIYPGLLIGSGYTHEVGTEGEFKLGFYFDHTTGLPCIPGSSLKGVLRSAFEHIEFIQALLKEPLDKSEGIELKEEEIKELELCIFGPKQESSEAPSIPMSERDIFYDAFPIACKDGDFLGADFITPHINRKDPHLSPFSNPIPLQFLKIMPGVTIRFDFSLKNTTLANDREINTEAKCRLFKDILLYLGVGAKTNVGYGQLVDPDGPDLAYMDTTQEDLDKDNGGKTGGSRLPQRISLAKMGREEIVEATVIDNTNKKLILELAIDGFDDVVEISYNNSSLFSIGSLVKIRVYDIKKPNRRRFVFAGKITP